jgi:hypothetical protein
MGYELDQLQKQYGVSSPSLSYGGAARPGLAAQPTADQTQAFADQSAKYASDQNTYNNYAQAYQGRLAATPMYGAQQFNPVKPQPTNPPPTSITDLYKTYLGRAPEKAGAEYWLNRFGADVDPTEAAQFKVAAGPENDMNRMNRFSQTGVQEPGNWGSQLSIPTYAHGGPVRFADGGNVGDPAEFGGLDMSRVSPEQLRMMQRQDPQAMMRGITRFSGGVPAPTEAPQTAPTDVRELLAKYAPATNEYAEDLRAARAAASKETEAFNEMVKRSMEQKTEGPSKAEMYFRLASAFGAPTKTGGFVESLGKANEVMGDYSKETRTAAQADTARRQQLGMSAQQAKMLGAKQDVDTLRALTAEEMKDKRALGVKMLEQQIASGKPMSDAGKIAQDAGLVPGTPAYVDFVKKHVQDKIESGDYFKTIMAGIAQQGADARDRAEGRRVEEGKKLTPSEVHLKTGTEDMLASTDQAMANLDRAFRLNPNTFDSSLVDKAQRVLLEQAGSKDPKVLATREQTNLLEKAALSQLKSTFPGAISNDERKVLMSVQGLDAKSREERALIMRQAYGALKAIRTRSNKRLNEINQGLYRETTPRPQAEEGGLE